MFTDKISPHLKIMSEKYNDERIMEYLPELSIPAELPQIQDDDMENFKVFNEDNMALLIDNLNTLLFQMPKYSLPPLLNDYSNLDSKMKESMSQILNKVLINENITPQQNTPPPPPPPPPPPKTERLANIENQLQKLQKDLALFLCENKSTT